MVANSFQTKILQILRLIRVMLFQRFRVMHLPV